MFSGREKRHKTKDCQKNTGNPARGGNFPQNNKTGNDDKRGCYETQGSYERRIGKLERADKDNLRNDVKKHGCRKRCPKPIPYLRNTDSGHNQKKKQSSEKPRETK